MLIIVINALFMLIFFLMKNLHGTFDFHGEKVYFCNVNYFL